MLVPTNESKEKIKRYESLWGKIRDLVRSIIENSDDYDEIYVKIKSNSDERLLLNKRIEIPSMTVVVGVIFNKKKKYFPQFFLDECLYNIYI